MTEPLPVGELIRDGAMVLACDGGTRAAAEGRDLASVCRGLGDQRLQFWAARFAEKGTSPYEAGILRAEMSRRGVGPADKKGQLLFW